MFLIKLRIWQEITVNSKIDSHRWWRLPLWMMHFHHLLKVQFWAFFLVLGFHFPLLLHLSQYSYLRWLESSKMGWDFWDLLPESSALRLIRLPLKAMKLRPKKAPATLALPKCPPLEPSCCSSSSKEELMAVKDRHRLSHLGKHEKKEEMNGCWLSTK